MVFLACSILCCLILKKSLSVFDRERDPLKEEELLNQTGYAYSQKSTIFRKSLKFLTKLDIPRSSVVFRCSSVS